MSKTLKFQSCKFNIINMHILRITSGLDFFDILNTLMERTRSKGL